MGKNALIVLSFVFIILCMVSCSGDKALFNVLDANYKFSKGDYTGATISYINAFADKRYKNYVSYNLGNTYSSLGEIESAVTELEKAAFDKNQKLRYRANFNLGVIYYDLGDFGRAVNFFKESLRAIPKDIDAKINLELSILSLNNKLSGEDDTIVNINQIKQEDIDKILDKIRTQEEAVWKSMQKNVVTDITEDW